VRARASEWGVDSGRVGIMGSSAGGHLASTLLTHFDGGKADSRDPIEKQSSRPDLGILCYAVITMGEKTHQGSKRNLLGENPAPDLVQLLSNELQVTRETPPTFLWHTVEDTAVVPENSMLFALALQKNSVPYELHVYEKGKHGIGLANGHPWTEQCLRWLKLRGFVR
jgi:acetyl esterase/lipase